MPTGEWIGDLAPEPEPPQEGRWIARPRKARGYVPLVACVGLLSQIPNLIGRLMGHERHGLWFTLFIDSLVLILFAVLAFIAVVPAVLGLLARRKTIRDRALEDGAFGDQYPVEVTVTSAGKPLGADRGVVWFADGLIGFSGEAFSFVLAASDLAPQWIEARREFPKGMIPPNALGLRNAPAKAYLHLAPLLGHGKAFWDRLRDFANADEPAKGERFWPPLTPYVESATLEEANGQSAMVDELPPR